MSIPTPDHRTMSGAALAADPDLFDQCGQLWLRAFAGPPWHATTEGLPLQRDSARRQLAIPASTAELALDVAGRVAGVAWGWPGDRAPDDELHHLVRSAVGPRLAQQLWQPDVVVLAELMVDPSAQGNGVGSRLLRRIVGGRGSWMLSHPDGAALGLYLRRGWCAEGRIDHHGTPLLVLARPRESP